MKYSVIITDAAARDLAESFAYIQERSPLNAKRWLRDILQAIHDLEQTVGYGRARESDYVNAELRQKVFKSHRIVFSISTTNKEVTIHYIRHTARKAVGEPESPK